MKQLTDSTFRLNNLAANGYLVRGRNGLVLIDPGLSVNLNRIARDLVDHRMSPYHVTEILLTHYDQDHAQSAAEWARRTGARVWIGRADAEIARGLTPVPGSRLRRGLAVFGKPELPADTRLLDAHSTHLLMAEDEIVEGIRAVPTPGHTPGHLTFVHQGVAFIGDAASVSRRGTLLATPTFLASDVAAAAASRAVIDALDVALICPGHGAPAGRR